jgi:pimeloyl-ACP methyl ester carboxylesterase
MSALIIDNRLVHYEAIGRGEPVLLTHGWIGSWRYWVPTMEELSAAYRAYAVDLWGFGDSDKPGTHYGVDDYLHLLSEFQYQLGIDRIHLVGHALGGALALQYAARYPERVRRVVAVGVPLDDAALGRSLSGFDGTSDTLSKLVARRAKFPEVRVEAEKADVSAISTSLQSLVPQAIRQALDSLDVPTLLVYGASDPLIKPPDGKVAAQREDQCRMFLLDGVHHFPMLECGNVFNRLLIDFLQSNGSLTGLCLKQEWQRRLR